MSIHFFQKNSKIDSKGSWQVNNGKKTHSTKVWRTRANDFSWVSDLNLIHCMCVTVVFPWSTVHHRLGWFDKNSVSIVVVNYMTTLMPWQRFFYINFLNNQGSRRRLCCNGDCCTTFYYTGKTKILVSRRYCN